MRPTLGRSPWLDRFPKSRIPSYPRHRGPLDVDVAIIGGGLTGCTVAYGFAAAGIKVALFEADRIGAASSGRSFGWVSDEPPATFLQVDDALGRRAARHVFQAWRRAALDFQALLRRLDVKCGLAAVPGLVAATSSQQSDTLTRELRARRAASIDAISVPGRAAAAATGFASAGALRMRDGATFDPYRATVGVAAAAVERGARIFERSPVLKTSFTRTQASMAVDGGTITTRRIVVATGTPTPLFRSLARHFSARASYFAMTDAVPARVRAGLGSRDHVLRVGLDRSHRIRWIDDDRLLVSGAESEPIAPRLRDKVLVQRTGQLMYELSTFYPDISGIPAQYGWDVSSVSTAHGVPVIGPHRNFPHHLFVLGDGTQSLTSAYLASRILLRHHLEELQPADAAFGFAL
jgi:glycine/D-amino acid oxidase-like deaminating enzyme